jgi:hypothetical protein
MKKEEIREWALLHWKQNKRKYMGEITNFENSSLGHWKHLQLEKPIKVLPKEYCIAINRIVTIPKLKNEIEDGLIKIGSFEADFNSFDQIKVKEAVVAMIEGYCKGGTEDAAFEQLQTHLKLSQKDVKRKSPHHLILWRIYQNLFKNKSYQPSAREVWRELENNFAFYDPSYETIDEVETDFFDWFDTKGNKRTFHRTSLDPLLSRLRQNPPE